MLVIVKAFCTTLYTTVNKKAWINRNFIKYIVSNYIEYGMTLANMYIMIKRTYLLNRNAMDIENFAASVNKTTLAGL